MGSALATAGSLPEAVLVREWADAWNGCDADRLLELLHPEFTMHRMKDDVIGRDGIREAVSRQTYGAAMTLFPQRLYGRGQHFAVAGRVEYRDAGRDELIGAADDGGMAFVTRQPAALANKTHNSVPRLHRVRVCG